MMNTQQTTLQWRLAEIMARKGIRAATELQRRLVSLGVDISSQQVSRMINKMPDRLNTKVFEGLLAVLECTPSELFGVPELLTPRKAEPAFVPPVSPRSTKKEAGSRPRLAAVETSDEEITGPKAIPMSIPNRRK